MTIKPSLFVQLAPTLVKNGWRPIPGYADTKRPSITRWNDLNNAQWPPDKFDETLAGQGQFEGEIVCLAVQREIVAIDLDILDEQQAQAAYDFALRFLGRTPLVRIGLAPKKVLIYRNDGSIKSRKLHPIEIFAGSGQVVGFGFHAKAGRDYQWPHSSPMELAVDDPSIPMINQNLLDQFLHACWEVVPRKYVEPKDCDPPVFIGKDHEEDRQKALEMLKAAAEKLANAAEGTRNDALFNAAYIAGQAIGAGLIERYEAEIMLGQAATHAGLEPSEIAATIRSGIKIGGQAPFFVLGQWFETLEDKQAIDEAAQTVVCAMTDDTDVIFDDLKPLTSPPSLIKGLLPRNGIAFIGGQSGAGKTFIAVDLAAALSSGQAFFGRKIKERVGIMFIAGEGAATIKPRLTIARMARNIENPLPIARTSTIPDFTKAEEVREFIAKLKRIKARMQEEHGVRMGVIFIDTLAAVFNMKDENDNAEAARIIRAMKVIGEELDVLMIPIHHYGKSADTGLRGASAWRAGPDVVLSVTAERNNLTGETWGHMLSLAKSRVSEEGPISSFSLRKWVLGYDEDGDEIASCFVVPVVPKVITPEDVAAVEAEALKILSSGRYRVSERSPDWAGFAISHLYKLSADDRKDRKQLKRILTALGRANKLRIVDSMTKSRNKAKFYIVVDDVFVEDIQPPK